MGIMGILAAGVEVIAGTGGIAGVDIWGTYDERFHEHASELGEALVPLVQDKTPVLSGSLQSSITYEAYPDPQGRKGGEGDLVFVYAEDDPQVAYWHRVYVQYVEGDPLGLPTYTNDPREMFLQTSETDGLAAVELWANTVALEATDMILGGAGVPWNP
jgi:hypothetical protein